MSTYQEMSDDRLLTLKASLQKRYDEVKAEGLHLNMARGKPSSAQLELSRPLLDSIDSRSLLDAEDGTDCRNYGVLDGLPEARKLMGDLVGVAPENVIVFGNSSLNVMFDTVAHAWSHGICGQEPWCYQEEISFLCPVPGYDRHFGITEYFGIKMIPVAMTDSGPDMDEVERLVADDPAIKGIWCVPLYSNPSGIAYSDETVRRFAALKPASSDFRIFWDNAYCVHHLYEQHPVLLDIFAAARAEDNEDIVYEFCSTSKITFPGAGIAALAASSRNLDDIKTQMKAQTIGYDKLNQLRHVRYFGDVEGIHEHMRRHADLIRPKFEAVEAALEAELGGKGIGNWTKPRGGYFISFDALPGCAKDIVAKAKDAGVTMTGAGATWPLHDDPADSNIRIAPTLPTPEELTKAAEVFVLCVELVSIDKLLGSR